MRTPALVLTLFALTLVACDSTPPTVGVVETGARPTPTLAPASTSSPTPSSPTPTPASTATPTSTPLPAPTPALTPTPALLPSPTPAAILPITPTATPAPTQAATPTPAPTPTPSVHLIREGELFKDFGYDENGNRVVQIGVRVVNDDSMPTDRVFVGAVCEGSEQECSSPELVGPISPGDEWEVAFRTVVPGGQTAVAAFVQSPDGQIDRFPIDVPHPLVRRPDLEPGSAVRGYWSDGTVDLGIVAVLQNEGHQHVSPGLRLIKLECSHDGGPAEACGPDGELPLPEGALSDQDSVLVRVPTGQVTLTFDRPLGGRNYLTVDVPHRIVGVDRDAWECFSDTSNIAKLWKESQGEGIGCAAWTEDWIVKWPQAQPLKLWTHGQDSWIREFLTILDDLSRVLNLRFEHTQSKDAADITAYIGVPHVPGGDFDETCREGALGCAKVKIRRTERIYFGEVRIHADEPDVEFADLRDSKQRRVRLAMLHEAVHALTWMQHRTEPGSIMQASPYAGQGINPMDEALLRIHAHPLVEPGMTIWEVENRVVFEDELLNPPPPSRLTAWNLVKNTYDSLREAGAAQFTIRTSSAGCDTDFGWADYEVGNIIPEVTGFGWVRVRDGSDATLTIHSRGGLTEHWSESEDDWEQVPPNEFAELVPGWRSDLADPHSLLTTALHTADWDGAEVTRDTNGLVTLRLTLNPRASISDLVLTVDPVTFALVRYEVLWSLEHQSCNLYRVEARDGVLTSEFEFPTDVLQGSAILSTCTDELAELSGFVELGVRWARQCVPSTSTGRPDGFSHTAVFSLSEWSVVRAEVRVESVDKVDVYLLSDSAGVLDQSAGNPYWDGWVQKLLPPGSYSVEVVSGRTQPPQDFVLSLSASKVPPPPHRFKHVETGGRTTCGLLVDGTPVCWGNDWGGKLSAPDGESFTSLVVSNTATCGLRADGTLVCWGLEIGSIMREIPLAGEVFRSISAGSAFVCGLREAGDVVCWGGYDEDVWATMPVPTDERFAAIASGGHHACGLRPDGTVVCWGANFHGQAEPPVGERFTSISCGDEHSCGLREDGSVVCWGGGGNVRCWELPDGTLACRRGPGDWPLAPSEDERLSSISSRLPVCGLRTDGTPVCWGVDRFGNNAPPKGERFDLMSSSGAHSCGLRPDGTVVCWGWDQFGQSSPPLGTGTAGSP